MGLSRIVPHLFAEQSMRRHFPARVLDAIQHAVAQGEAGHDGQVCFAIEGALRLGSLFKNITPRQRAEDVFAHLRVWDTQNNSGVLIYVLLAEHAIEIVADRGIAARVPASEWESICIQMQKRFAAAEFEQGAVEGVAAVSAVLAGHFPATGGKKNELQDRPVLL
ncbi:MAG: TPM domain-containing protein [Rudaea sp.]